MLEALYNEDEMVTYQQQTPEAPEAISHMAIEKIYEDYKNLLRSISYSSLFAPPTGMPVQQVDYASGHS